MDMKKLVNESLSRFLNEGEIPMDEVSNLSSSAQKFLEEYGEPYEEEGVIEFDTGDLVSFVVDNWADYWSNRNEMYAEQEFPDGVMGLIYELDADYDDFCQYYGMRME